ncbi:MAG: hypothetical protein ACE5HO_09980 [bacterium]
METTSKRVLVAEASDEMSWLICKIIRSIGYETVKLGTCEGPGADDPLEHTDYLVFDYFWFCNQATEVKHRVARIIKEDRALLLSSLPVWAIQKDVDDYGFKNILEKPFDISALIQRIEEEVRESRDAH